MAEEIPAEKKIIAWIKFGQFSPELPQRQAHLDDLPEGYQKAVAMAILHGWQIKLGDGVSKDEVRSTQMTPQWGEGVWSVHDDSSMMCVGTKWDTSG